MKGLKGSPAFRADAVRGWDLLEQVHVGRMRCAWNGREPDLELQALEGPSKAQAVTSKESSDSRGPSAVIMSMCASRLQCPPEGRQRIWAVQ